MMILETARKGSNILHASGGIASWKLCVVPVAVTAHHTLPVAKKDYEITLGN